MVLEYVFQVLLGARKDDGSVLTVTDVERCVSQGELQVGMTKPVCQDHKDYSPVYVLHSGHCCDYSIDIQYASKCYTAAGSVN